MNKGPAPSFNAEREIPGFLMTSKRISVTVCFGFSVTELELRTAKRAINILRQQNENAIKIPYNLFQ